jgi:predicted ribosome quality control (RQC) complex YloA/Tae2 family protein
VNGHVQKVRVAPFGAREVALLEVRVPGETLHVVLAEGLGVGVLGLADRGRLKALAAAWYKPGEARARAIAERAAQALAETPREALAERGARIAEEMALGAARGRRDALKQALTKAAARVERRIAAVRGDLERAESAGTMAERAQLFVAEAARAPRGTTRLVAVDWSSGEPREVDLKVDPARGAQEQVAAMFQRARRLKEGARVSRERLADAERALAGLARAARELADASDAELEAIEARARAAAPRDLPARASLTAACPKGADSNTRPTIPFRPSGAAAADAKAHGRGRAQPALPPYRVFLATTGARILVGRSGDRNDALTFRVARPHDLWLHTKDLPGAHVVVPLDKNATCPAEVLVDAAHLAAHFSEARDEPAVLIQYTPRRYVRKPRGSAPGLVVVDREKVMTLRRDPAIIRRLLEHEV